MLKTAFILILGLLVFKNAGAQKRDTLMCFVKNSGDVVANKDSADYIMFIMPNDPADKKSLYPVRQYYMDGKRKLAASSHTQSLNLALEGTAVSYFANGFKKTIINHHNGYPEGDVIFYYPNGKLYAIKTYEKGKEFLKECRDSTGKVLAENGNGQWLDFDIEQNMAIKDASVHKGQIDGEWHWIEYSVDEKKPKIFMAAEVQPAFKGGIEAFYKFLAKTVQYPGVDFENKIQGKVFVSFVVEKDGSLTDVKAIRGPDQLMNDEAVRAIKLSPPWVPGMQHGRPVRVSYTVPVNFTLKR